MNQDKTYNILNLIWFPKKKGFNPKRFIELDLFRGLAIILMIFGHILWDLDYFGLMSINNSLYSGLQRIVPPLFFTIVGISIIVSRKKKQLPSAKEKQYNINLLIRGLKIFNLGMILTIITMIAIPDRPVYFGVLHCIGLSIILCVPFLKLRFYNLIIAISMIIAGLLIGQFTIQNPTIFHLIFGLHESDIWSHTVDYFPLLPWMGATLFGMTIGDYLYCGNKRRFKMPDLSRYRPAKIFSWFGQHSLEIYLLHQPVIAGFMYVFAKVL